MQSKNLLPINSNFRNNFFAIQYFSQSNSNFRKKHLNFITLSKNKIKEVKNKGPSIKDVRTKSRKIDSHPLCPQNVRTNSTSLSVQTHHKFRKIRSFLHQKAWMSASPPSLSAKCPHWTNSPHCERHLRKASNLKLLSP